MTSEQLSLHRAQTPAEAPKAITPSASQTQPLTTASLPTTRDTPLARIRVWFGLSAVIFLAGAVLLAGFPLRAVPTRRDVAGQPRSPSERSPWRRPEPQYEVPTKPEDWLPTTRSEALHALGLSQTATGDLIKMTVRRLRRAWHPDLAQNADDRRLRDQKLKQINVAWDIVSGKRAPRFA